MASPLTIQLNGQPRTFTDLSSPSALSSIVQALDLKGDRIAVELNGQILPRGSWNQVRITENDRLEIVHFVGGGR
ncbi:MAG: sulfur carrier protein ThiS [Acidobacteriota bacterium]